MLEALWGWIFGYYVIHIYGKSAERFVNLALQYDIAISDIRWLSDSMAEARVAIRHADKLDEVAAASGCDYEICLKRGLPVFFYNLLTKRLMLLIGGALAFALLYVLCTFALFVEVSCKEPLVQLDSKHIMEQAADYGVGVGKRFSEMDFDKVEKKLMIQNPLLAFCDIEKRGTLINIKVAEKASILPEDKKNDVGAIWAGKDALIDKVLVLYGQTDIKSGDTVSRGDLLVSPMADGRASAIVKARVWYEACGECALREEIPQNDGSVLRKISLRRIGGSSLLTLCGYDEAEYQHGILLEQKTAPLYLWRGVKLPLELVEEYYQPQNIYVVQHDAEGAKAEALARARRDLKKQMNLKAELLHENVRQIEVDGDVIRLKVTWECMEDIGVQNNV